MIFDIYKIINDKLFRKTMEVLWIKIIFFAILFVIEYITLDINIRLPKYIEVPLLTILFYGIMSLNFSIFFPYDVRELHEPLTEKIGNRYLALLIILLTMYYIFYISQVEIERILTNIFGKVIKKTWPYKLLGYIIGNPLIIFVGILISYIIRELYLLYKMGQNDLKKLNVS